MVVRLAKKAYKALDLATNITKKKNILEAQNTAATTAISAAAAEADQAVKNALAESSTATCVAAAAHY